MYKKILNLLNKKKSAETISSVENTEVYADKMQDELNNFKKRENVHELANCFYYIAGGYISPLLMEKIGVPTFQELILKYIKEIKELKDESSIEILSLGSGNCDLELNFAKDFNLQCNFTCIEINPDMIKRATDFALENGLNEYFSFISTDINKLKLEKKYDIIIANHSLHHFVELEHIFKEISNGMNPTSYFIINDMIGRNGHMFWDETLDICNRIWSILPKELKYNHILQKRFPERIQWDCSVDGFEGIRCQDILPLLDLNFNFKDFAPFCCLINWFIDRDFGHNYDVNNKLHKSILDMIWNLDEHCLLNNSLRPTMMMATLVRKDVEVNDYKYTYFEKPSDIYNMPNTKIYNILDK